MDIQNIEYNRLIQQVGLLLKQGRQKASLAVNTVLVQTYWEIGRYIVEFEQKGNIKAEYGVQLLENLSKDLTLAYGKGFGRSNLFQIRKFYSVFSKIQTPSGQSEISQAPSTYLTWSHFQEILKADLDLEIQFYVKQTEIENWSVRELKRQMKSSLFERLALSKDKEGVLKLAKQGNIIENPEDLIKDPFVLDFLNFPQPQTFLENDLEEQIISNIQRFIMELGKGFAFIGRQYRMNMGGRHFYLDLLFYHRILKCFVLVDLKRGEIDHQDVGQMNLYLNYFKKEEATEGDNEPVGIILGAHKNYILVEYATDSITNKVLLSKYQLYLPNKEQLQQQLSRLIEN